MYSGSLDSTGSRLRDAGSFEGNPQVFPSSERRNTCEDLRTVCAPQPHTCSRHSRMIDRIYRQRRLGRVHIKTRMDHLFQVSFIRGSVQILAKDQLQYDQSRLSNLLRKPLAISGSISFRKLTFP